MHAVDTRDPGDTRPSEIPDDTGRAFGVVAPSRPPCAACGRPSGRRRRRGCCIACYRKFRACGVALPVPPPPDLPRWLMDRMTQGQRDKALAYLGELVARGSAETS